MSTSTKWSIDPLLHGYLSDDVLEGIFADISNVTFMFTSFISLPLLYPILHKLFLMKFKEYRALEIPSKQIVVIHHAVEAIVLFFILPSFTYFFHQAFFQEGDPDGTVAGARGAIQSGVFIFILYVYELASRFEEPRAIVVFHHVLALVDLALCMWFPTTSMLKPAMVGAYFICFECVCFMGLFLYRMAPHNPITPKVIFAGMVVFGVTRPIQVLCFGAVVFGSWNDETTVKWQGAMQFVVVMVLTATQVLSLKIHYGVWQRCIKKNRKSNKLTGPEATNPNQEEEDIEDPAREEENGGPSDN